MEQVLAALDCDAPASEVDDTSGGECLLAGTWPTRVWADLPGHDYAFVLDRLGQRGSTNSYPCPIVAPNPIVVAGDGWIVLSSDSDGADRVHDVLGGEIRSADRPGVPISIQTVGCTVEHESTTTG